MDVGRRRFLTGATAAVVGVLVGCGNDEDGGGEAAPTSGGDATTTTSGQTSTTSAAVRLPSDPFGLGVASGDPAASSVVLWTRLALDPLAADGLGAMPAD